MLRKTSWFVMALCAILASASLRAADAPANDDSAVAPFLEDTVLVVARVDEAALDLDPVAKWVTSTLEASKLDPQSLEMAKKRAAEMLGEAQQWVGKFRAAGGKRIYAVLSMSDLPDPGPFLVVPLGPGADAKALAELFPSHGFEKAETINGALVYGYQKTLERLKAAPPAKPRAELAEAFAAVSDAPVRVALIPSSTVRQSFDAMMPALPEKLGGGPITLLTHGMQWAVLGITPPPKVQITLIVSTKDADVAQQWLKLEEKAAALLAENAADAPFDVKAALKRVTPKVNGKQLTISLAGDQMAQLIRETVVPTIVKAREAAEETHAMVNVRQLLVACETYYVAQNKWPDSLDQIADQVGGKDLLDKLIKPPPRAGQSLQIHYRKPADPKNNLGQTVVIYETFDKGAGAQRVAVGFGDTSVQLLSAAELKTRLEGK